MIDDSTLVIKSDGIKTEVYLNGTLLTGIISVKYESSQETIPVLTLQMFAPLTFERTKSTPIFLNKKFNVGNEDETLYGMVNDAINNIIAKNYDERIVKHPNARFTVTVYTGMDYMKAEDLHKFLKLVTNCNIGLPTAFGKLKVLDSNFDTLIIDGHDHNYGVSMDCAFEKKDS